VRVTTTIGLPEVSPGTMVDIPGLAVTVAYRDAAGFAHYRTHTEREYVPRTLIRRRPKYPDHVEAFKRLFPDAPVESATEVASGVERQ
jgi:hypothetical protein